MIQSSGRASARYGDRLRFIGNDLPGPHSRRVPPRHGQVRTDLYLPPGIERQPAYVHLHGGAFLMRFPKMD